MPGYVNVDFQDVKTVMMGAGAAVMGSATMEGEGRARRAAEAALVSPLLNNREVHGAQKILLSIISGEQAELQMDELTDITEYIQEMAGDDADVIFGHGVDANLGNNIRVTLIATGFDSTEFGSKKVNKPTNSKQVYSLDEPVESSPLEIQDLLDDDLLEPVLKDTDSEPSPQTEEESLFELGYRFENPETDNGEDEAIFNDDEEETQASEEAIAEYGLLTPDLQSKKDKLEMKRKERLNSFDEADHQNLQPEEIKNKLDEPAYTRKKIKFEEVPHSSERNLSRLSLNDENQILGNNKYLHDNVD